MSLKLRLNLIITLLLALVYADSWFETVMICVPMWAPVVALLCRFARVREDVPPRPWELLTLVAVWTVSPLNIWN